MIVEPHAVDDGAVGHEPKEARSRVSGLAERGERANLDVTESELTEADDGLAVLVESGGYTER